MEIPTLSYSYTSNNTCEQALPTNQQKNLLVMSTPSVQGEEKGKNMARLIRYTVVDADPILAEKTPEESILTAGVIVLNGTDDRGFVMDLASKLGPTLDEHNTNRVKVEYEDKEGKTKNLKPVKISQLDVVIETLKTY